jgi:hypothetical protein
VFLHEVFNVPYYNTTGKQHHVQLFDEVGEFAQQGQALEHLLGGILAKAGLDELAFAAVIQVQAVDDRLDELGPPLPGGASAPGRLRRAIWGPFSAARRGSVQRPGETKKTYIPRTIYGT